MACRTRTYIAADWDGDSDLVSMLQRWNESEFWSLSFPDAHELMQARDTSKACSIKRSLYERLECSRTFVLVVGEQTVALRKGSCQYCPSYTGYCRRGHSSSTKSFIGYECDYAARNGLKVVVLYNMARIDRSLCPEALRYTGDHLSAWRYDADAGEYKWDYLSIKLAIERC